MSGFDPNRRNALKHLALLGATGLVPALLPIRPAPAASLIAGFVYIGPREDLGWNQSHAVAAMALRGVPGIRVVQAVTCRRAPTTEAQGRRRDQSLHRGDGGIGRR
jgi:simple sugar transport system substrate-binding protein